MTHTCLHARRSLVRRPGFSYVAVLSLALSVGANTAVFSIVNALSISPPAEDDPSRLAVVYSPVLASSRGEVFDHLRASAGPAIERLPGVAAVTFELSRTERFGDWRPVLRLATTGSTLRATAVAHDYFSVLGVAIVGRPFLPDEERRGADLVAVVSDRLWRQWRGEGSAPPEFVATTRGALRIVGVAPPRFHGPRVGDQTDVWIPFGVLDRFSDMLAVSEMAPLMPVTASVRIQTGSTLETVALGDVGARPVVWRRDPGRALATAAR